jgi:hypothetical protein
MHTRPIEILGVVVALLILMSQKLEILKYVLYSVDLEVSRSHRHQFG